MSKEIGSVSFTVSPEPAAPAITNLAPDSAPARGPDFTLTVNGTNFLAGGTVNWNGTALATTFVSATQLTATVSASLISTAVSAKITVTTSGGTSPGAAFRIDSRPGHRDRESSLDHSGPRSF